MLQIIFKMICSKMNICCILALALAAARMINTIRMLQPADSYVLPFSKILPGNC